MRTGIVAYAFNPSTPEVEAGRSRVLSSFWFGVFRFIFYFMYMSVLLAFVYLPCVCLVPTEVRRSHQNPGNWS